MQCQILGCKNKAQQIFPFEGIDHGIGSGSVLYICWQHDQEEIQSTIQEKLEEISNSELVNPYKDAILRRKM